MVPPDRLPKILEKIDRTLDTPYGPALFLPSYTSFNPGIGRVTAFAAGTKENAAVFSHACAFKVVADCTIKRGDQAYDTFSKLLPVSKHKKDHDRYKVEPYVWAEYVIGPGSADRFGEGAFTWNTGTTPWMFNAATEWILGARREFGGLLIDPCLPRGWKQAKIRRPFRGAMYEITLRNPEGDPARRIWMRPAECRLPTFMGFHFSDAECRQFALAVRAGGIRCAQTCTIAFPCRSAPLGGGRWLEWLSCVGNSPSAHEFASAH